MVAPAIHEHRPIQLYKIMARLGIEPSGSVLPRLSLRYATAIRSSITPHGETNSHAAFSKPSDSIASFTFGRAPTRSR
jgi:hypothetical protein